MSGDGPILLDHVMRVARRYVSGEAPEPSIATTVSPAVPVSAVVDGKVLAENAELRCALEDLRQQAQQCQRDLETRTQQLDLRKQEVQALQNKLRVVHVEAKRRGYNFHDLSDRVSSRSSDTRKTYDSDKHHGGRDSTPPRSSRSGCSGSGTGEYVRPPLPPLRVDMAASGSIAPITASIIPAAAAAASSPTPPPLPPLFQQAYVQNMRPADDGTTNVVIPPPNPGVPESALGCLTGGGDVRRGVSEPVHPQTLAAVAVAEVVEDKEGVTTSSRAAVASAPQPVASRKNGAAASPIMPQHLVSQSPGAMLFCRHCRLFLAPHQVSVTNHLQSEGHQSCLGSPMATGPTYTQFGKLVQKMPSFIGPVTVVSEEQKRREAAAGNAFFESGFDIVHSTCTICQEAVTTQSYKVHESLATHRRRAAEAKEDGTA
ncbi:hypothetical protein DQ04_04111050 [Trypanosoma grayi]|uniref:hypothetical protein n=1 Tax=Trypanosoma grayi TaxID=71804 RepID=UPI0004F43429|nr:hypothetical protein DQ04_04111050 [Trypanosoma grayi]KEG10154.1 hypothetical protein DQ04_04111050 [Trypanosoma grayi]